MDDGKTIFTFYELDKCKHFLERFKSKALLEMDNEKDILSKNISSIVNQHASDIIEDLKTSLGNRCDDSWRGKIMQKALSEVHANDAAPGHSTFSSMQDKGREILQELIITNEHIDHGLSYQDIVSYLILPFLRKE